MKKKRDLGSTRKINLSAPNVSLDDQLGNVFKVSPTANRIPQNVVQHGSNEPGSTGCNLVQPNQVQKESPPQNVVQHGSNEPGSTGCNLVQRGSEPGSTAPGRIISLSQLLVLRVIANKESTPYEPVTLKKLEIARATSLTLDGVKTAVRRLLQKGAIQSINYRDGRKFGGTTYKLTQISREILSSKTALNLTWFNLVQRGSEPGSAENTSSSGINIDLKTTTTSESPNHEKFSHPTNPDPAWEKIDLECLTDIGFKQAHVAQVRSWGSHTPKSLQDSIYAFKFDLNENKRGEGVREPLNFFMGILRKGPYTPPANYESPEDRQLRGYLEAKEKLLEKRREKLNRLKAVEFEEWAETLSPAEIEKLAPMGMSQQLKRSQLLNHFDENLWEKKKQEILERLRSKLDGGNGSDQYSVPEKNEYTTGSIPPLNPPATRVSYDF